MAGGSLGLPSSNFSDKTENDDKSVKSDFVDAREVPEGKIPQIKLSKLFTQAYTPNIPA